MQFDNAYFITGTAYAGKSTMVKLLAEKHGGVTMDIEWTDGSEIRVGFDGQAVVISANREGLLSLAKQFEALANEPCAHIHYDAYNSLADGSTELIVEKV